MKIVSIVGARPQFIKLAPLSKEVRKYHQEIIVHTGQHFDEKMSKIFFDDLQIPQPDYNLEICGGSHGEQTGKMLQSIEIVLLSEKPDLVIVFGDTNSTLAGSLAAVKLGIKTIHVEAGLRSFNRLMPEEINRIASDHISDYLFAPTVSAIKNLECEGLGVKSYLTGDIMVDSLRYVNSIATSNNKSNNFENYYLLTLHRPYNVDDPSKLRKVIKLLNSLNINVVFPVHPRTRNIIRKNNIQLGSNIKLMNPLGYLDFIKLQSNAEKIITDSGGIQKEAYILQKPCITLRSETEWIETVESGWNKLIDVEKNDKIVENIIEFSPPEQHSDLFGNDVSKKMVNIINNINIG
jgi:UDP-GlcNAc3NAcA epimerase